MCKIYDALKALSQYRVCGLTKTDFVANILSIHLTPFKHLF